MTRTEPLTVFGLHPRRSAGAPADSCTRQVTVPVAASPVFRFTPLPTRWALCTFERSRTTIVVEARLDRVQRLAGRVRGARSPRSGPTVSCSFFTAEPASAAVSACGKAADCRRRSCPASASSADRTRSDSDPRERDRPGDVAGCLDAGEPVDTRPGKVEVVLGREVADDDVVRARIDLRDELAVRIGQTDDKAGADRSDQLRGWRQPKGAPAEQGRPAAAAARATRPLMRITPLYDRPPRSDWTTNGAAPGAAP